MSNALKFTYEGGLEVTVFRPTADTDLSRSGLDHSKAFGVSVADSGIGIPEDKQLAIFEAFQQADGSTSRQFGGTGLGLSICREIAKMLGGEIHLSSYAGKGSTFTFFLPCDGSDFINIDTGDHHAKRAGKMSDSAPVSISGPDRAGISHEILPQKTAAPSELAAPLTRVADDRDNIKKGDTVILVIEDDVNFAHILVKQCREKDFKCLVAHNGEAGLQLAAKHHVAAIILDIKLPGINGWSVLESLKHNSETRHIPVHMMSVGEAKTDALNKGAVGFLTKPVQKEQLDEALNKFEKHDQQAN